MNVRATLIEPSRGWFNIDLASVWRHREILGFLVWRSVKVRYKQAAIGVGWAIIQPILTVGIFTVLFGRFARMPSDGLPYSVFALAGLLPWTLFSQAVSRGSASLIGDAGLLTKVYFPRLIVPLAAVAIPLVDFIPSFIVLLGLMGWHELLPTWRIIALPFFLLVALSISLGVSLWLAPLNVRYRDIGHAIPFLLQIGMYASPVVYPASMVGDPQWRALYGLNPMVGVIEGVRWSLLGQTSADIGTMAIGFLTVPIVVIGGLVFFKRMERTFADIV